MDLNGETTHQFKMSKNISNFICDYGFVEYKNKL